MRKHFHRLATPQDNAFFNDIYANMVESDVQQINQTLTSYSKLHVPITQGEVELAISKLSNKKQVMRMV